ncbi:TetR/AcrR family transcriptional regulator [Paenibacillus marinisediminis]
MSSNYGDKQNLILDAAYELFGSNGFYETKMSDIAKQAGIAKGTLYLYFTSKEQLFAAISKRDFDQFLGELEYGIRKRDTLQQRLAYIADYHLRYYFDRRKYTNLFFKAPNNDPEMMSALREFTGKYMKMLADTMEEFNVPEPKLHAKSFVGILDVIKMDILYTPNFTSQDLEERIAFSTNIFMNGCVSEDQPRVLNPNAYTNTQIHDK